MKRYFESISDPRQRWKVEHNLHEIVIMTICAVMSGCEIWEEIVDFCKVKQAWFQEKLELSLENGLASHDTFQRVFQLIRPEELEDSFIACSKTQHSSTSALQIRCNAVSLKLSGTITRNKPSSI